jgi:putative transposase
MPRRPRAATGGHVFHVLNRAVARLALFAGTQDYDGFVTLLDEARQRVAMRLLGYCVMPNHWHLVLWPREDGDLSEYVRWLTATQVRRWHEIHHTSGSGALYQGRFKSFPVEGGDHYFRVLRYVERNALRAGLVDRAEEWPWSSLAARLDPGLRALVDEGPVAVPPGWTALVNEPDSEAELEDLRRSVQRGSPFGRPTWSDDVAARLALHASVRRRTRGPRDIASRLDA